MLNKEISLKKFLIILGILVFALCFIYLILIPSIRHHNLKEGREKYCLSSICNEDKSICYAYDLDSNGKTIIKWRGSCN